MNALSRAAHARGLTLVELLISMVLGLIITGGALAIIMSNRQSYLTNEALSQVQESARSAFELLARDVRQAGATGCDNTGRVANVIKASTGWWQNWVAVTGYEGTVTDPAAAFGTAAGTRVQGTDSIQLRGVEGSGLSVESHNPTSANIKLNATTSSIATNDILMICDFDHAAIFQVTQYNSSNVTLVHNASNSDLNCSKGLGYPTVCTTNGTPYTFGPNSQISRLSATDWYIGNNGRPDEGGRSLYRRRLGAAAGEEIVAGVTNLQIRYRVEGATSFVDSSAVAAADWDKVNAVSLTLVMDSADRNVSTATGVNSGRLQRSFTNIVTLRNRVP